VKAVKSRRFESLLIGLGEGRLLQWSVRQGKVTKDNGMIGYSEYTSTADAKHMFVGYPAAVRRR
jgi:hypothetical protein